MFQLHLPRHQKRTDFHISRRVLLTHLFNRGRPVLFEVGSEREQEILVERSTRNLQGRRPRKSDPPASRDSRQTTGTAAIVLRFCAPGFGLRLLHHRLDARRRVRVAPMANGSWATPSATSVSFGRGSPSRGAYSAKGGKGPAAGPLPRCSSVIWFGRSPRGNDNGRTTGWLDRSNHHWRNRWLARRAVHEKPNGPSDEHCAWNHRGRGR